MNDLKILDFAVIVRNIVDIGKLASGFFQAEEVVSALSDIVGPESEAFHMTNNVFQAVCPLARKDMARFELPTVKILDQRGLFFAPDEDVIAKFDAGTTQEVDIYPALHRSGTLIVNMHAHFQSRQGFTAKEAIKCTRLNLRTLAIELPKSFIPHLDFADDKDRLRWIRDGERAFMVGSLKDLASRVVRPLMRKFLAEKMDIESDYFIRVISSTLTQIYKTDPACESIDEFVSPQRFGREILGIGALDRSYHARSELMVAETFDRNLSADEELGVFTFGLSDLLLFNDTFEKIVEMTLTDKKIKAPYSAVLYNTSHYSCLLEWVYLEKFIIDRYSRLLSKAIGNKDTTPEHMLALQKESMHDLLVYKAGITPFPSREEFLERARHAHRIPEMQEKLEKKRDLATDYVIQEYTLRTNRGIQLVNIFVSATAVFGLMEVVLSIVTMRGSASTKTWWAAATTGLFVVVLLFLSLSMRFFTQVKKR